MQLDRLSLVALALGACLLALLFYRTSIPAPQPSAFFGGVSLTLEYATTGEARERGLSGRASIPQNYGMLFVFPSPDYYGFWMKGMLVPLDIYWLDDKGHVVSLRTSVSPATYPDVLYPSAPARYVLETNAGFGPLHGVKIGTTLLLQSWPKVSE